MKKSLLFTLSRLVILSFTFTVIVSAKANDRDLRGTTVPASACIPASQSMADKLRLSNAAWVFTSGSTGSATLYCALPRNGRTLSDNTNDNDASAYRVFYRDSDGQGSASRVRTRLVYRGVSGLFSAGVNTTLSTNSVTNTASFVPNNHDLRFSGLYSFIVTLSRSSTAQSPAFSGIDFTIIPIP